MKKLSKEEWIEKARKVHGDKYDYSESVYVNTKTPMKIYCREHDDYFTTTPASHISQLVGCSKCKHDKQAEFLRKCHEKWGDIDDYSKVKYIDNNHKVCIVIDGEERWFFPRNYLKWKRERKQMTFYTVEEAIAESKQYKSLKDFRTFSKQAYDCLCREHKTHLLSFEKSTSETMSESGREYTFEYTIECAHKCHSKSEFYKKYHGGWRYANEHDKNGKPMEISECKIKLIDTFDWFETPHTPHNSTNYVIYVYIDYDTHTVYIGLSKDMKSRDRQHRFGKKEHGVVKYDTVWKGFHKIGKEVPDYIIKMDELNALDAQYYEEWYEKKYRECGWNVINIAKPGSLGGNWIVWTEDKIRETAALYENRTQLRKSHSGAYNRAWELGILDELYPQTGKRQFSEEHKRRLSDSLKKYWSKSA